MPNDRFRPTPEVLRVRPAAGAIPPNLAGRRLLNLSSRSNGPSPGERLVWLSHPSSPVAGATAPCEPYPLGLAVVLTVAPEWGRKRGARSRAVGRALTSSPARVPLARLPGCRRFSAGHDENVDPPSAGPRPGGGPEVRRPSYPQPEAAA
jgi:hypothetical protein